MIFLPQIFRAWPAGWFRQRNSEFEPRYRFEPDTQWERGTGDGRFGTSKQGGRASACHVNQRASV